MLLYLRVRPQQLLQLAAGGIAGIGQRNSKSLDAGIESVAETEGNTVAQEIGRCTEASAEPLDPIIRIAIFPNRSIEHRSAGTNDGAVSSLEGESRARTKGVEPGVAKPFKPASARTRSGEDH